MSEEYPHLLPATRPLADAPPQERVRHIKLDRWIGYPRAEAALVQLQELVDHPQRTRMPSLILVGATNNGKSMLLAKFARMHGVTLGKTSAPPTMEVPVLYMQMPSGPDEKLFFAALFKILGMPGRLSERLYVRQQCAAMRLIEAAKVRVLAIDEIHNLLAGNRTQQRRFLNLIRWMGNELNIPMVAGGTVEGLRAVQSDDQLANRFTPFVLRVAVLKTMTFINWQADPCTDDVMRRFARGQLRGKPLPAIPTRRYGLCLPCLKSDAVPHLRKQWTLGWVVACEKLRVRLHATCQQCWAGFMLPLLKNNLRFDINRCPRQGCEMSAERSAAAHPAALRLQASLIAGRAAGAVDVPFVGRLEWPLAVALIDFVLSVAWTPTGHNLRRRCYMHSSRGNWNARGR